MKISIKVTAKDLFDFSMYSSYSGYTGLFNVIFTVGALALLVLSWSWTTGFQKAMLVLCALIFTVVQPAILYKKSRRQAAGPRFAAPINLTLTDEKIAVEQSGVGGDLPWDQIWKVVRIKSMYILKVGPTHAYLIPNSSFENREEELVEIFKKNLPEKKRKGIKA